MDDMESRATEYLVINHFDGREEKVALPPSPTPIRVGRETDNDVVLSDPRASRYHAQVRRGKAGLEIMDVGSANGTLVGAHRIEANVWQTLPPGSVAYLGDTTLAYQPSAASAATVAVAPVTAPPPARPLSATPEGRPSFVSWAAIAGVLVILLIIIVGAILWTSRTSPADTTTGPADTPSNLGVQTPGAPPSADTPSAEADGIPYPVISVEEVKAEPIILGALPDPTKAFIIVRVRVENLGTGDFTVSPSQFQLLDASGAVFMEQGSSYSESGLRKLGLADRFEDLRLRPGGSVPESLLFAGEAKPYQFFLRYEASRIDPITLDLGGLNAEREVAIALGTPVGEETPVALAQASATLATEPTPTATRPPQLPAPRTVPTSSLVGTIAYPVFNGTTYDLYFGNADGSGTSFYRDGASQPQFSPDGSRIAYHSWLEGKRALITINLDGSNEYLVAKHLEDQLPTWSPDGESIIYLSRRSGQRASELIRVTSTGTDEDIIGNGEYPTWAEDNQLAFKGWGETPDLGLRIAAPDLSDPVELTDNDTDTAPAVSPDGEQIAFMSRRDGNWNIYIINSDGTGLRQLTDDPAEDGLPTWSPDGNVIAFVSNRGGPWAIWAITPSGGGARQLFTMEGSPDGFVAGEDLDKSRGWAEERISWTE
jgi:TolB protein